MGAVVFDNEIFDSWLTKKSDEILSKVDREAILTEEMLILILKAQTNHFHHIDIEFRNEFRKIDDRFDKMNSNMDTRFEKVYTDFQLEFKKVDERLDKMNSKIDDRFEKVNLKIDDRFEKVWSFQKWQAGILFGLFAGLYLKLFLG